MTVSLKSDVDGLGGSIQVNNTDIIKFKSDGAVTLGQAPAIVTVSGTSATASAGYQYIITNAAATTITLPTTPAIWDVVWITVANNRADNVLSKPAGTLIQGVDQTMIIDHYLASFQIRYISPTVGWRLI